MVHLNRIYTRSGDAGETHLGDGTRVPKTHARIIAFGAVDELNSAIGLAIATDVSSETTAARLRRIQNNLFDLGADLAVPETESETEKTKPPLRITPAQIAQLEGWIDEANADLAALESFVLPGGNLLASHLHLARAICRRAEITVIELSREATVNPEAIKYLNRLSDLLFVLARAANNDGADDVLWQPGE